MSSFYIGRLWSRHPRDIATLTRQWFEDEHPEMFEWVTMAAGNRWDLETKATGDFDYVTGWADYDVYITYDNIVDAVHHKLRWHNV